MPLKICMIKLGILLKKGSVLKYLYMTLFKNRDIHLLLLKKLAENIVEKLSLDAFITLMLRVMVGRSS
jgi:hypothetical protein